MSVGMYVAVPSDDFERSIRFYVDELQLFEAGGQREYKGDGALDRMKADGNVYLRLRHAPRFGLTLVSRHHAASPTDGPERVLLEVPAVGSLFLQLSHAPLESGAVVRAALMSTPIGDIFSMYDPAGNRVDFLSAIDARRGGVV